MDIATSSRPKMSTHDIPDFPVEISRVKTEISDTGLITDIEGKRGETVIYDPQILAAYQIFAAMFTEANKSWVHLVADMQAGKTGAIIGLIRLVLANFYARKLDIPKQRILIISGMNDKAWEKQTRNRIPDEVKANVYFSKTLIHARTELYRMRELDESKDESFGNVLIIVDESHIAHHTNNLVAKHIYRPLSEFAPFADWQNHNIRLCTVSATDPAKVLSSDALDHYTEYQTRVIRLYTTIEYQSIRSLLLGGRLRYHHNLGIIGRDEKSYHNLRTLIDTEYDSPHYHIIRPIAKNYTITCDRLREMGFLIHEYNSATKSSRPSSSGSSSFHDCDDINELLSTPPEEHTIIIIKNMFYAAKTLDDTYVGILWDRDSVKDSTALQSLLGRACGYGKSKKTIVVSSNEVIRHYLAFWGDVREQGFLGDRPIYLRKDKIVHTNRGLGPDDSLVTPATPHGKTCGKIGFDIRHTRSPINNDDYFMEWSEYPTYDEAKAAHRTIQKRTPYDGFYLTSLSGSINRILTLSDYDRAKAAGTTSYVDVRKMHVGKKRRKFFTFYRDPTDPSTGIFVVKVVTRIR